MVTLTAISAGLLGGTMPALAAPLQSPPGQVLIVDNNLLEGFGDRDLENMVEVRVFVRRLLSQLPYRPDVLLLQEVRHKSAAYAARLLTNKTGNKYLIAAGGARDIFRQVNGKIITQDSAILINSATMSKVGSSGYITTRKESGWDKPEYRKHAFVAARRIGSELTLPMVSLHIPESGVKQKSELIAKALLDKSSNLAGTRLEIMAGDFNTSSYINGKPSAFWNSLTSSPYDFRDSVETVGGQLSKGVDFIFARAGVHGAGVDASYDPALVKNDPSRFYSDHRFRWALLGGDRSSPTTPANLNTSNRTEGVYLNWGASTDTDSGLAGYEVWRVRSDGSENMIGRASGIEYTDRNVYATKTYTYYVRAYDHAHNRSPSTETVATTYRRPD